MPNVTLRVREGASSEKDIVVSVQEKTFEYLRTTITPTIRVSAYFDQDCPHVEKRYAEILVDGAATYRSLITRVIPGSRKRTDIELPGPMYAGEQLTIEVERKLA
jgi:hypothetical protein